MNGRGKPLKVGEEPASKVKTWKIENLHYIIKIIFIEIYYYSVIVENKKFAKKPCTSTH